MKKKIPHFKSESEERRFWSTADSTRYVDWKRAQRIALPNLRPSLKTISLRLPELMLEQLKLLATKRDDSSSSWPSASRRNCGSVMAGREV